MPIPKRCLAVFRAGFTGVAFAATSAAQVSQIPSLEDRSGEAPLADVFALADPKADAAWASEKTGELISKQLKVLGEAFAAADWAALPVVEGAKSNAVLEAIAHRYSDQAIAVSRPVQATSKVADKDLVSSLGGLRDLFGGDGSVRVKFKLVGVEPPSPGLVARARAVLEIVGEAGGAEGGTANLTAQWDMVWRFGSSGSAPLLESLLSSDFEYVRASGSLFAESTGGLLGEVPSYREQLSYGADHWYGNLDVSFGIHHGNQGLAIGDADGDGHDDLFVCQPAGLPSRLYLRNPDGTLRDATVESGVDWLDNARSALFVDLDNDRDQDLLVSLNYSLVIFENRGAAKFDRNVIIDVHSWPASIAAADYDSDSDLDIYICGYNPRGETAPGDIFANPVPFHDANNGARNFLIENLGGMDFRDVTAEVGLSQNNRRFSFAASWEDYDNDGDPDLYVANDFGRNNLYRNDPGEGGRRLFRDVAAAAGVEDIAAGMSVSWGDFDRDGLPDLYTSNMFSAAGNRVTSQDRFKPSAGEQTRSDIRRHARGNTLYRNLGGGRFEDVSVQAGVTLGRWAWGSMFTDFNNDGNEDIYVTNGFFSTPDSGDL